MYTETDLFIPYTNQIVAAAVCKGVPVKYELKGGSRLSDNCLQKKSFPNVVKVCGYCVNQSLVWTI